MQKLYHQCEFCNAQSDSAFGKCTPEQLDKISASKTCSNYKKGQHIFHVNTTPLGVYCICKGIVKLVKTNNDGKEQVIRFAQSGGFLGYRALIADEPLVSTAICIEDTTVCFIPKKNFLELLEQNSLVNWQMLKSLSHDLGVLEERIQSLAQKSVRERVAESLLFLHSTFKSESKQDDAVISITLPREDIANIVGTATETVIRLLSEFKAAKLIAFEGKKIKILNKPGLEKISNASL